MLRRPISIALAAVALALPASAAAQSAGDNQYTDPLAGGSAPRATPQRHTSSTSPTSSSAPAAAAPSSTSAATPATAPASATPLANTGFEAWQLGVAGLTLCAAAFALARSARRAGR